LKDKSLTEISFAEAYPPGVKTLESGTLCSPGNFADSGTVTGSAGGN